MQGPQIAEEGPSQYPEPKTQRPDTFTTGGPHVSEGATKQECGSVLVVTVTVRSLPYPLRVNQN